MSGRGGSTRTIEQHGQPTPVCQACQRWLWRQRISHGGQCSSRDPPALTSFALADLSTRARLGARRPIGPPPPPDLPHARGGRPAQGDVRGGAHPAAGDGQRAAVRHPAGPPGRQHVQGAERRPGGVGALPRPCPLLREGTKKARDPILGLRKQLGFLNSPPPKDVVFLMLGSQNLAQDSYVCGQALNQVSPSH